MKFPASSSIVIALCSVALGSALFVIFLVYLVAHTATPKTAEAFPPDVMLNPDALTAKSAIIYDPADGRVLFAKDGRTPRPLASLTKLMTAQAILSTQSTDQLVTITPVDIASDGFWGFKVGDVVKLSDLLRFGLVASSNDAMAAAATSLGGDYLDQLNQTAGSLGLSHTYFLNPTGLDLTASTSGAYGTAGDVALLAASFLKKYPQYFELSTQPTVTIRDGDRTLWGAATEVPLQNIPGFIGAKTGYTDLAGGNLVAAYDIDIGHPLIAVVLGSTEKGRFSDIRTLIEASRASLSRLAEISNTQP
ncbi:MAG: D-alanyl-D-alanine carboxypeptidase [Patescibacteria group bacterium]|nr:D-alanyl-D-alanine carboxypeptidase [Patescibacteria group bacterium]